MGSSSRQIEVSIALVEFPENNINKIIIKSNNNKAIKVIKERHTNEDVSVGAGNESASEN